LSKVAAVADMVFSLFFPDRQDLHVTVNTGKVAVRPGAAAMPAAWAQSELLFGHPRGLYVLTLTETWERFSYYGMRALLILYLTQRFLLSDNHSFAIYGAYTALVYISPLLGGMLADRWFGFRRSVMFGASIMILGHFGLAVQDFYFAGRAVSAAGIQLFYFSIACLITGVGFLKGNISTMVGNLYPRESRQRDSGFIIFIWGVDIGAALAAFSCGYVGQTYGWGYGFGMAGIAMCIGLASFVLGRKYLDGADIMPARRGGAMGVPAILLLTCLLVSWALMQSAEIVGVMVALTIIAGFGWTLYLAFTRLDAIERDRLWCALIIWSIWACYAALIEQTGSSLNLFTQRLVQLDFAGFRIQASQLQGVTTFAVLVFSPFFAWAWSALDRRGLNPRTELKLSSAIMALAAGFALLGLGTAFPDSSGKVGLAWLLLNYLCFAVAAIIVQPIGLSAFTRLTATPIVGFMVGMWMLAVAVGSYFAAQIAKFSALDAKAGAVMPAAALLAHYRQFFAALAVSALLLGLVFFALTPLMRRWMHGMR
jgi:proton-dependent oligopeptide transporter, POT family